MGFVAYSFTSLTLKRTGFAFKLKKGERHALFNESRTRVHVPSTKILSKSGAKRGFEGF